MKIIQKYIKEISYTVLSFNFFLTGCASTASSVIATSGTTIGVEISQNQANQTPTAVLGYKRAELAYVPTNRATSKKTTTTDDGSTVTTTETGGTSDLNNGARDSANVLMELRYKGIFSWGDSGGIYQRLAVGDIAVAQPGAALMFSKSDSGQVDADVARYVADAQEEITVEKNRLEKIISYVVDGSDSIGANTLNDLITKASVIDPAIFTASVKAQINGVATGAELKTLLFDDLDAAIPAIYKSLPTDKQ